MISLVLVLSLAAVDAPLTQRLDDALVTVRSRPGAAERPAEGPLTLKARAEVTEPLTLKASEGVSMTWLGVVFTLAAAAGAVFWRTRRKLDLPSALRVVQHAGLGKGRDIVVIEHDGRRLLLGVTASSIAVLVDAAMSAEDSRVPRGIAAFEHELRRTVDDTSSDHRARIDALTRGSETANYGPRTDAFTSDDAPRVEAFTRGRDAAVNGARADSLTRGREALLEEPRSEDESLRRKLGRTA